jgi:hypothetical protein
MQALCKQLLHASGYIKHDSRLCSESLTFALGLHQAAGRGGQGIGGGTSNVCGGAQWAGQAGLTATVIPGAGVECCSRPDLAIACCLGRALAEAAAALKER